MSEYGSKFDILATHWAVLETEHDKQHPDRDQCGGVGACSMMYAAVTLQDDMIDALAQWRKRRSERPEQASKRGG